MNVFGTRLIVVGLILAGWNGTSYAQYIGPGSTPQGDILRGQGIFLDGAGRYELNAARGRSIDADTEMRWNQYVYESIKEHNRIAVERLAKMRERNLQSYRDIRKRIRENPDSQDLNRGDALNALLEDLSNPKISPSSFRSAKCPLDGGVIQNIPFQYAQKAGVISIRKLAVREGWPLPLRGEAFGAERRAYVKAVETVLEQDLEKKLVPESVKAVEAAVEALKSRVTSTIPTTEKGYYDAKNFVAELGEAARMLSEPVAEAVLAEIERYSGTTVADLLDFMRRYNLRFSPAVSPTERDLYKTLYPMLRAQYDLLGFKEG